MSGGVNWTSFADAVIRELFPTGGAVACHRLLPDRTIAAIDQRACRLRRMGRAPPVKNPKLGRGRAFRTPVQDRAEDHRLWQSTKMPVFTSGNLYATLAMTHATEGTAA